ncbi:hypothetical protein CK203_117458 [Vitis vinifera]|uniref:Aspartic peptidase DDI1-type domain-containing protein n=1 Tax=Vitis vinifera TaxID=29760 RepID=A0A438FCM3_VITVI|nr:hypothetical protein CK203_117458 [Vitis vinifera]
MKSQPNAFNAKAGLYTLNEDVDMKAKFAAMTRRLEELELKRYMKYKLLLKHQSTREMFGEQANVIGQFKPNNNASYGNTYNSSWRNHLNFSWKPRAPQYAQLAQPSQQASNLEQAIVNLSKCKRRVDFLLNLTKTPRVSMKWKLMRESPHRGRRRIDREEGENQRNKKDIGEGKEDHDSTVNANQEKVLIKEEMMKKHTPPPFPQALHGKKGIRNASEIHEVLRQVKVNIPLLDMIKQVPTYAKFLKDLCTIKRGLYVNKKAFLTEQVSAIIQCKSPLKYKDPRCPTISVMIGGKVVEKALLDLGASVNLLPYSVYKQLRLVDFVVFDTDPIIKETNHVPVILGRPFLATSNAIINCRNGLMQLTFCNMTLKLNIFYMSKKLITPEEEEGPEEVCIIDTLVEKHCWRMIEEILPLFNKEGAQEAAKEETSQLNLKSLPTELKYTYLEENQQCPVVISSSLTSPQEKCLLEVLKRCKKAIGWQISNLKGISSLVCTHHIYMEEEAGVP